VRQKSGPRKRQQNRFVKTSGEQRADIYWLRILLEGLRGESIAELADARGAAGPDNLPSHNGVYLASSATAARER
jgi:hypothetical protein